MILLRPAVAAVSLLTALGASAAEPPQNQLTLSASASAELPNDRLTVVLSTAREGNDAAQVQSALTQALDAALAEARAAAVPGRLEVRTGNFALHPRYSPKGGLAGWQGSAELVLEGRDVPAISRLAGRLSTLAVSRVGWSLSREAREKAEAQVAADAIARWRAKAADYAKQFGFAGYTLGQVGVSASEPGPVVPFAMARAKPMAAADEALPVEAGNATVTVSVSGSVLLTR